MVPNVFVSSTIADLHFLRDAIRDVIKDLGFNPILSDYGDISYVSPLAVQDACYQAMRDCNLAVLIIGKRYGSPAIGGLSVTHNEFRVAKEKDIPVLCIIQEEVLAFKKVYDTNKKKAPKKFPDMDDHHGTFKLIDEFVDSKVNNGYRSFKTTNDARETVVKQFALFFGELLREKRDPIKSDIKDVLAQLQALQHRLITKEREEYLEFQRVTRLLIDDNFKVLFQFISRLYKDNFDAGVTSILSAESVEALLTNNNWQVIIKAVNDLMRIQRVPDGYSSMVESVPLAIRNEYPEQLVSFAVDRKNRRIELNQLTSAYLDYLFRLIKENRKLE